MQSLATIIDKIYRTLYSDTFWIHFFPKKGQCRRQCFRMQYDTGVGHIEGDNQVPTTLGTHTTRTACLSWHDSCCVSSFVDGFVLIRGHACNSRAKSQLVAAQAFAPFWHFGTALASLFGDGDDAT